MNVILHQKKYFQYRSLKILSKINNLRIEFYIFTSLKGHPLKNYYTFEHSSNIA